MVAGEDGRLTADRLATLQTLRDELIRASGAKLRTYRLVASNIDLLFALKVFVESTRPSSPLTREPVWHVAIETLALFYRSTGRHDTASKLLCHFGHDSVTGHYAGVA